MGMNKSCILKDMSIYIPKCIFSVLLIKLLSYIHKMFQGITVVPFFWRYRFHMYF